MSAGAEPRRPVIATSTDEWLSVVYDRLGQVLDRLPDRSAPESPDGRVEVREPIAAKGNLRNPKRQRSTGR